ILPVAPPTSTTVLKPAKSYAWATAGGSALLKPTIASLKWDASSGCLARKSKIGMPHVSVKALLPVSSEYTICSHGLQNDWPQNEMSVDRAAPGAPVLRASPSGVSA